jgi:hypothetical protein
MSHTPLDFLWHSLLNKDKLHAIIKVTKMQDQLFFKAFETNKRKTTQVTLQIRKLITQCFT